MKFNNKNILFSSLVLIFINSFFITLYTQSVLAESGFTTNWSGGFRNYPSGFSVAGEAKFSQYLWDHRQESQSKIQYGLLQESVSLASHGFIGWDLHFYPISFIRLSAGQSIVSKYYDIGTLPCRSIECKGILKRNSLSVAFVLGYEQFIFLPQWTQVWMKPQSQTIPFGSEDDYLVGAIGGDKINSQQMLLGYKYQESLVGLFIKTSQFENFKNESLSRYFIVQKPINVNTISSVPLKLTLGIGLYSSTWVETPQMSAMIGIKGGAGDDPALF